MADSLVEQKGDYLVAWLVDCWVDMTAELLVVLKEQMWASHWVAH